MTDKEQKQVFSRNLNRYLSESGHSQREVASSIGVSPQTFNTWCQGIALPRMGKVQRLADFFCIDKTDLIDPPKKTPSFAISPLEKDLVTHYRAADPGTQGAVRKLLDVEEPAALPEHLLPMAAHAKEGANTDGLMSDVEMLLKTKDHSN